MANKLYGYLTNTPQPEDYGFDRNNGTAIDETWKYVTPLGMGLRRLGLNALKNLRPNTVNNVLETEELINRFFDKNNPLLEDTPEDYIGRRNIDDVLNYLGSNNKNDVQIKSPIEDITFNRNNLAHLLYDNEPERLQYLNRLKSTFEEPYYIIKEIKNNKSYNGYYKPFLDNEQVDGYFGIIKNVDDGNFYTTSRPIRANLLRNKINNGQVIYNNLPDHTAPISKDMPVNNILNDNAQNFNPSLFERIMGLFKN